MNEDANDRDLILSIHAGVFEEPCWDRFLTLLRDRLHARHAGITFRSGPDHVGLPSMREFRTKPSVPEHVDQRYVDDLYRYDPVPYHSLAVNRVYAVSDFLNPLNPDHMQFFTAIMQPSKFDHARMIRVIEPGGADAWCTVARDGADFSSEDHHLLEAISPHLSVALRTYVTLELQKLHAGISSDVVQRLNFGWLSLDAKRQVVDMDGQTAQLLRQSSFLQIAGGRLTLANSAADRTLAQMISSASAGKVMPPRLINISEDPWCDMLVLPVSGEPIPARNAPVLTIYVQGERQGVTDRIDHLMELFGLSANEAKLALMLSRGRTIAQCASALGLTLESARTYSKRIYAKTGTRGQGDLIRLILTSVVALA